MATFALVNQKGGTGKTTLGIALACELHRRGERVLLVDTDPQGTARTFAAIAAEAGHEGPTVAAMGPGLHRPDQLPRIAEGFGQVVIDCPPGTGQVQRSALVVADVALLPVGPSPAEVWALAETIPVVEEARTIRPDLRAALVINRRDPRTALGRAVRESLATAGLPILAAEVGLRVAFAEALAAGLGPTVYAPGSEAAAEVRALADEVLALAGAAPAPARRRRSRG